MPQQALFHPRTLGKALQTTHILKDGKIPPKSLKVLQNWQRLIDNGSISQQNEGNLHPIFFSDFCEPLLGYKSFTNQDKRTGEWTVHNEASVKSTGRVDIGFGKFSSQHKQLTAPLELKSPKTSNMDIPMLGRSLSTVEQAAKYARNSQGQAQWFIVSNCIEIRLYRYPYSDTIYQSWQINELTQPEKYAEFVLLLGAKNLLSGTTLKLFENSLHVEKEITDKLYADYRDIRIKLINGMKRENNRIRRATMVARAQTLLDRVLFIAYAEDTDLLPDKTLHTYISRADHFQGAWEMLKMLFADINLGNQARNIPKYNGDLFKPNPELEELSLSDGLIEELGGLWKYDFATDVSVTILGHIFEQSIADLDQIYATIDEEDDLQLAQQQHGTSGKRKQDGVVYTPDFITRWIVEQTLGAYLDKQKNCIEHPGDSAAWWLAYRDLLATTRILDPACGSGAFLVAAFQYLKQAYAEVNEHLAVLGEKGDLFGVDLNHDILNNNLFGVDINAESVEIARLSLWLVTAEKGKLLTSLKDNIRQGNSIIADKTVDKNAFNWFGRFKDFDIILGNPPYVRQERLSPIKPYLEANYQTYHGVADLYTYFFELGLKLLKKGGYMGFISSSTFFKTGSGEKLREYLKIESNLQTVVDFGDLQVFEGVTTYPAILVMEKPARTRKQAPKDHSVQFLNVTATNVEDLGAELQEATFGAMQQAKLAQDGWRLEDERLQALRNKIVAGKRTLKEVYGSPLYGIKTGRNEAFVIDRATRNRLITEDAKSAEIIKPFLEGKDLKQWRAESRDIYLIFTRRGIDLEQYPAIKTHLERYREMLEPKPKNWSGNGKWLGRKPGKYEWHEIQDTVEYYKDFENPKVIYNRFMPSPLFWLDSNNYYVNNALNVVPNSGHFEAGLFNSRLSWFVLESTASRMSGGFYQIHGHVLEKLPIPNTTDTEKANIAKLAEDCQSLAEERYKQQEAFRLCLPDLSPNEANPKLSNKLKNWWELDFPGLRKEIKSKFKHEMNSKQVMHWKTMFEDDQQAIQTLSQQLASKEAELNQAVYALFKLDADEIALLEANLK